MKKLLSALTVLLFISSNSYAQYIQLPIPGDTQESYEKGGFIQFLEIPLSQTLTSVCQGAPRNHGMVIDSFYSKETNCVDPCLIVSLENDQSLNKYTRITQHFNTGEFASTNKTYDSSGLLQAMYATSTSSGADSFNFAFYSYDSLGRLSTVDIIKRRNYTDPDEFNRRFVYYDSNDQVDSIYIVNGANEYKFALKYFRTGSRPDSAHAFRGYVPFTTDPNLNERLHFRYNNDTLVADSTVFGRTGFFSSVVNRFFYNEHNSLDSCARLHFENNTVDTLGAAKFLYNALNNYDSIVYFEQNRFNGNVTDYVFRFHYSSSSFSNPEQIEYPTFKVEFSPNPAHSSISFHSAQSIRSAEIFSLNGTLIHSLELNGLSTLDVSGLPQGMYVIKWNGTDGNVQLNRLLIQ